MVTRVENISNFDGSAVGNTSQVILDQIHIAKEIKELNNFPIDLKIGKQALDEFSGKALTYTDEAIPNYGAVKNTFLGKICPNLAKADKTLAELKVSKKIVKNLFDCDIKKVGNKGKLVVSGSSETGKFLSKTLGRIPRLNLALASAFEAPNMIKAAKNGDLGKQTVRSTANILLPTIASSMAGQLACKLAPAKYKTVLSLVSAIGAGVGANKMLNKAMDKFMGESIQKQNEKAMTKLAEMKELKAVQQA